MTGTAVQPPRGTQGLGEDLHLVSITVRGSRVHCRIELRVPGSAGEVWERVSDLPRFLTIDPFHRRVVPLRPRVARGVDLVLRHSAFGVRILRFGRILSWEEGRSYAVSDLSARGPAHGFPHVFRFEVEPAEPREEGRPSVRLLVEVRGKWTARWIPPALVRGWLWLVCRSHQGLLEEAFRGIAR